MRLYIDTSDSKKVAIAIDDKKLITESRKEESQRLLPFILETLKKSGHTLTDISEIKVHTGPGSFTGLRVGLTVANALSYALKVPVNGKRIWEGEKVDLKYD